uniref:Uncharacterized protein n=1 Tax=Anguilla anguilla TaxID=7936 RepID=A0A0E9R2T2_ANGAN
MTTVLFIMLQCVLKGKKKLTPVHQPHLLLTIFLLKRTR